MTTEIERILRMLALEIDAMVDRKVEEKLPEMIRALGLHDAGAVDDVELGDVIDVAKLLHRDISTPKKIRAAKLYVYNLARSGIIPSIRLSPKRLKFDLRAVRHALTNDAMAKAS